MGVALFIYSVLLIPRYAYTLVIPTIHTIVSYHFILRYSVTLPIYYIPFVPFLGIVPRSDSTVLHDCSLRCSLLLLFVVIRWYCCSAWFSVSHSPFRSPTTRTFYSTCTQIPTFTLQPHHYHTFILCLPLIQFINSCVHTDTTIPAYYTLYHFYHTYVQWCPFTWITSDPFFWSVSLCGVCYELPIWCWWRPHHHRVRCDLLLPFHYCSYTTTVTHVVPFVTRCTVTTFLTTLFRLPYLLLRYLWTFDSSFTGCRSTRAISFIRPGLFTYARSPMGTPLHVLIHHVSAEISRPFSVEFLLFCSSHSPFISRWSPIP